MWRHCHTTTLGKICEQCKVKKLYWLHEQSEKCSREIFFPLLEGNAVNHRQMEKKPFSDLREIEINTSAYQVGKWKMENSQAALTLHIIDGANYASVDRHLKQCLEWLPEHFGTRKIYLRFAHGIPINFDRFDDYCPESTLFPTVLNYLQRNRQAWKKCNDAIVIFIGMVRRPTAQKGAFCWLYKDPCRMIVAMLRETRGTSFWK